jgi:hypothetical protein
METILESKVEFKHDYNQIDPRDKNIIDWSLTNRRFITEISTLKANGIEPESYWDIVSRKPVWKIWLWSEKYQQSILYSERKSLAVRDPEGELIAEVYVLTPPVGRFYNIEAYEAAKGTTIHILND